MQVLWLGPPPYVSLCKNNLWAFILDANSELSHTRTERMTYAQYKINKFAKQDCQNRLHTIRRDGARDGSTEL